MTYSNVQYIGNGASKTYYVPFQYLAQDHVKVSVGGALQVAGVGYTWTSSNAITLTTPPAAGTIVDIRRSSSPNVRLVDFQDGSTLTQEVLDLDSDQLFYIAQENIDGFAETLNLDTNGTFNAKGKRLTNLATPINASDAVTKQAIDTIYPAVVTVSDNVSSVNIVASDLGSTFGHVTDLGLITESTASVPPIPSRIDTIISHLDDIATVNANIVAIESVATNIDDITNAAGYAASASTSATTATTAATNAATSASAALSSKDTSVVAATNAATSATNAATSATNASNSANSSAVSATNASNSAATATTKAAEAASSATSASSSATAAASSASSASSSASSATSSSTASAASATSASNSASVASTAATNAAASATSATSSATTATSQASIATTKAAEATASANAAATAQTAAETARDQTLAAYDSFDDRYLGTKTSDPSVDNDGNALVAGALYFNSLSGGMKVYTGTAWVAAYASLSGALLVANNLSDLGSLSTARSNLGLASVASSGAYSDLSGTPTTVSSFTNDAGFITTAGARAAISVSGSLSYNSSTGVMSYTSPTYATVASTGAYSDLTGKPTLGSLAAKNTVSASDLASTLDLGSI